MVNIVSYHPKLCVEQPDGGLVTLTMDLDNWYEDREVWRLLGAFTGAETIGGILEAFEGNLPRPQKRKRSGGNPPVLFSSVRIERGDERQQLRYKWDDPVPD